MEHVDGVTVVLYTIKNGHPRIAVLRRTLNWDGWELVKGRKDGAESVEATARREIEEETGIEPERIETLDITHEWRYERDGTQHQASYDAVLAKAPDGARISVDSNTDEEHSKGLFLNPRDARDILTHENQKELIDTVKEKLER